VPVLAGLRPTPQRLRQTLFDWLAPVIAGANVLDAFAGSGALGIEALSRGARAATFIERDPAQARAIEADLARLHLADAAVRCGDALRILTEPATGKFDIVFLDPPFDAGIWGTAVALLDAGDWLTPQAWVYVEAGTDDAWGVPGHWQLHRQRDAGAVRGTLYRVGMA
jgi:16S rRNA (guanine966-N2)-methyltransferase